MTHEEVLDSIVRMCRISANDIGANSAGVGVASVALIAIEGLRLIADKGSHPESSSAKCDLHKIIASWPEELL
jgi:hypothetical protein